MGAKIPLSSELLETERHRFWLRVKEKATLSEASHYKGPTMQGRC